MAPALSLSRGEPCEGCDVQVGQSHRAGCLEMECPETGLVQANCPGRHGHSGGGIWTGLLPGEGAAASFGWYAALVPGEGWVPVPLHPGTDEFGTDCMPDLNRVFAQARWDRASQKWVKPRDDATEIA